MKKKCILIVLIVLLCALTISVLSACGTFGGGGGGNNGGGGTPQPEGNGTITLESYEYNYEINTSYKIDYTVNDGSNSHYTDYYTFNFISNSADATVKWVKRNDGRYDSKISASKEGIAKLVITYQYKNQGRKYVSDEITFNFKCRTINSAEDLKSLANSDKEYVLGANIDLSDISNWTPIENFTGILDGKGYTISGLNINSVNQKNIGLFGTLKGKVENLKITSANITARGDAGNAGILAGTNEGTISNVTVGGEIAPLYYDNVGGVVGYNLKGTINDCTNNATVKGNNCVGGIVGYSYINENDACSNNVNNGVITGKEKVGGVIGYLYSYEDFLYVSDYKIYSISTCENKKEIIGTKCVGGVIGYAYAKLDAYFEFSLFENSGEIIATGDYVGGILGYGVGVKTITTSENSADITGNNYVGGFVGYTDNTTTIKALDFTNTNTITGRGYVGGIAGKTGVVEGATNNGTIVSNGIILENGANNAYVGGIAGYCTGLIGCTNNSDITVKLGQYTGGLAGYVRMYEDKKVSNNTNNGKINGFEKVGGVIGYLYSYEDFLYVSDYKIYSISTCENKKEVIGTKCVGGVIGYAYAKLDAYFEFSLFENSGEVIATGDYVGGILGYGEAGIKTISVCDNTADITGNYYVGGLVGYTSNDTTIKANNFTNKNTITGRAIVGGVAGQTGVVEGATNNGTIVSTGIILQGDENNAYVGGVAGICGGVTKCVNNSNIDIELGNYVGGIVGELRLKASNLCNNNTNNGDITGRGSNYGTGGIVGNMCGPDKSSHNFTVSENINKGSIVGNGDTGGVFGSVNGVGTIFTGTYFTITYCRNEGNVARYASKGYVGGIAGYQTTIETAPEYINTNSTLHGLPLFGKM